MNPDSDNDLIQTLHAAAHPRWAANDAALEAALDDAAKSAPPMAKETAGRIVSEALSAPNAAATAGRGKIVSAPAGSFPRPAVAAAWLWRIAAALALLGTGFGIAWFMRPSETPATLANAPEHDTAPVITPVTIASPPIPKPATQVAPPSALQATLLASTGATDSTPSATNRILATKAHERSVHRLADDSLLWLDEETRVTIVSEREIRLENGRAYVEVAHRTDAGGQRVPFVMQTPRGPVTALGTKFAVNVAAGANEILVTEGKVTVPGLKDAVLAGHWSRGASIEPAPQAAFGLGWTRGLRALIAPPAVPESNDAGGALRTADGSEAFTLRRCHVDVHIEDGIARTTIDQTYFNHLPRRLEGTFYFPLPPDASISRLAMYVNGKLMEGGMAEREEARRTFETIKYKMQDPALLEWVDGSTFKMRVFPLEGREEKRIIISYTQRLDTLNGRSTLRVPVGHSLNATGKWSFEARVKNGRDAIWRSANHDLKADTEGDDLLLRTELSHNKMKRDVVLEIASAPTTKPRFSTFDHEGWRYLAVRWTPSLPPPAAMTKRHWAFLVETSADRDAVLARTQREVLKGILSVASADDTFSLVTAGTRAQSLVRSLPVTAANRDAALAELEKTPSIGALDLGAAFHALGATEPGTVIVHLGSATPVLGELENAKLLDLLPKDAIYAGIAVGGRWNVAFARAAASRTGGWFTRINPDEAPGWRAFEFVSAMNSSRLTDIRLTPPADGASWLLVSDTLAQGGELCALTRLVPDADLPDKVEVSGVIAGKEWKQMLAVGKPSEAGWLPRAWAKLELDRLVNDGAEKHHADIVALSKASYVMSPFTSLLVLENDAMYAQYKVDRGRKDHWAMYPCPDTMAVVREPLNNKAASDEPPAKRTPQEMIDIATQAIQSLESDYGVGFTVMGGGSVTFNNNGATASTLDLNGFSQSVGGLNGNNIIGGWATTSPLEFSGYSAFGGGTNSDARNLVFNGGTLGYGDSGQTLNLGSGGIVTFNGVISGGSGLTKVGAGALILNGSNTYTGGTLVSGGTTQYGVVKSGSGTWILGGASTYTGNTTINGGILTLGGGISRSAGAPVAFPWLQLSGEPYGDNTISLDSTAGLTVGQAVAGTGIPSGNTITSIIGGGTLNISGSNQLSGGLSITNGNTITFGGRSGLTMTSNLRAPGYLSSGTAATPRGPAMSMLGDLIFVPGIMPVPPQPAQRSGLSQDEIFLRDLTIYAAGFTTTDADRASVADESLHFKPGTVADDARALVERARKRNAIHRISVQHNTSTVSADGGFLHDERNIWGLREIVTCDGKTLRHLYPEIGLGTERTMTATRWHKLDAAFPWIIAPVEILALDADVTCSDSETVEIMPHQEDAPVTQIRFNHDGKINERWMLTRKDRTIITRELFNWNRGGLTLRVLDKNGAELQTRRWTLASATDDELKPAVNDDDLVILPMPAKRWGAAAAQGSMPYMATLWISDRRRMNEVILHDYLGKGDKRPGWFVLALSGDQSLKVEAAAEKRTDAIARYVLAESHRGKKGAGNPDAYAVPTGENAFVDRLMRFREAWRWAVETGSMNDLDRAQRLSTAMKLGDLTDAPGLALTAMRRAYQATNDPALLTSMAEFIGKVKQQREDWQLGYAEAETWLAASDAAKAAELFETWFEDSMKHEMVVPPGPAFHRAFFAAGDHERYTALVKRGVNYLANHNRRIEALQFAGYSVPNATDAGELITQAADYAPTLVQKWPNSEAQAAESLIAAQSLGNAGRHADALEYTRNAMSFLLGRNEAGELQSAALAQFIQRKTLVLALQRSLGQQPNENDGRELADAAVKLLSVNSQQSAPVARLIASWLESSQHDLAQDYRTSPLALAPNQSAPWIDYANDCAAVTRPADAEYALNRAFAAEQTNADILLRHAQYLDSTQRAGEARKFYQQIVNGTWGPNYNNAVWQAKQKLGIK